MIIIYLKQKNIHEIVIQKALKAADPDGNTKTTLTGLVSSITPRQLDRTGHKDRVAIRKEVQHVKENNPNLTNALPRSVSLSCAIVILLGIA